MRIFSVAQSRKIGQRLTRFRNQMQEVTRNQKLYFVAVGILALWVGAWGYFVPAQVDTAIPWLVPPLHARFLGAMYLSGATFMLGGILARTYDEVRVTVPSIAIWTGTLFIISLFYLGEFDYSRNQVWIWFGAYLIYPLIALWLAWQHRHLPVQATGSRLPSWAKQYLLGQATAVFLLSLLLLFATPFMVSRWPWAITPLLAQIYAAPFLAYAFNSFMTSRQQTWREAKIVLTATFVFALGVLLASIIHRQLFDVGRLATWLWFGGFTIATLTLGRLTMQAQKEKL